MSSPPFGSPALPLLGGAAVNFMARKDSRSKRRKYALGHPQWQRPSQSPLTQFLPDGPPRGSPFSSIRGEDFLWDLMARRALRLESDDAVTSAIRAAFQFFN